MKSLASVAIQTFDFSFLFLALGDLYYRFKVLKFKHIINLIMRIGAIYLLT